jgi:hypothetical protein
MSPQSFDKPAGDYRQEHSQFPHLKLDEEPVARCKNGEAGTGLRLH